MRIKSTIFVILFLFLMFNAVYAFEPNELVKIDLKQSIDMAKKRNIDMQSNSLDIEKVKNNIVKANRLQNPNVFSFNNFGAAGRSEPQLIGISQPIEIWKRSARKNVEQADLKFVKDNYASKEYMLEILVREAYLNLIIAKSILAITQEQQDLLKEILFYLKETNNKNDEESNIEIMQAEIALNLNIAKVNSAKASVENARLIFNKILNVKDGDERTYDCKEDNLLEKRIFTELLTPSLEDSLPGFINIAEISFENRFDIRVNKAQIDLAEKKLALTIRQKFPDFEISGGYSFQYANQTDGQGHLSGAFVGVNLVNIPIFYNYTPEIKNAKIELEQAILKYNSTRNIAEHQLKSAYENFKMAKKNLNHFDKNIVEKSNEVLKISKKSFKQGKSTITTFILIEQSHIDVEINYVETLAEYYQSWINLLKAIDSNKIYSLFDTL
ncbi:MAG: TolC family protein [Candidatus Gastranaerophilales bacterium]|nr:TolC family protein [Candidatus Gastranaerophilales bacterium]